MFSFKSTVLIATLFASVLALPAPDAGAKPFTLKNGQDAIALNDKFTSLSPSSSCTAGQEACVNGQFAQCVGETFQLTPCAGGTVCVALPLVNKPGTSITCDTAADRDARIAATGATSATPAARAPAPVPAPAEATSSFALTNGKDAQELNKQFESLTPASSCTAGQEACVDKQFAQCVNGKFVLTGCAGGLQCAALPLVNSPGTSITCVDNAQAIARIAATGAGSSLTGN